MSAALRCCLLTAWPPVVLTCSRASCSYPWDIVHYVVGKIDAGTEAVVRLRKAVRDVVARGGNGIRNLHDVFIAADSNRDDSISVDEFRDVCDQLNMGFSAADVRAVWDVMQPGRGDVHELQFMRFFERRGIEEAALEVRALCACTRHPRQCHIADYATTACRALRWRCKAIWSGASSSVPWATPGLTCSLARYGRPVPLYHA